MHTGRPAEMGLSNKKRRKCNDVYSECLSTVKSIMKAARLHIRGGSEQLVLEDVPKPFLKEGDALVKIVASGITHDELGWGPTYLDESSNERLPSIPGHEFSGIIDYLPQGFNRLAVGDEVYGLTSFYRDGTAAEYVAVPAVLLCPKPLSLSHIQAAAVPLSALTAMQGLFTHGGLTSHKRILIHGAAGGVGCFAIQFAKWSSAHVVGTCSARNVQFVKEMGADEVIDYNATQFEKVVGDVDIVFDTIGGDTRSRSWQIIKKSGVLVTIASEYSPDLSIKYGVKGKFFIVQPDHVQLKVIASLIDRSIVKPVIQQVFPLEQIKEAFELGNKKHNRGKIVISINP